MIDDAQRSSPGGEEPGTGDGPGPARVAAPPEVPGVFSSLGPRKVVDGVELNVRTLGTTGPILVMLHGLITGSLASWYLTAAPTLVKGRRIVLYDQRGHGMSERPPTGYEVATMAAELAGVIEGLGPVSLVGHSYGALIALHHTVESPQQVKRLVLVEPALTGMGGDQVDPGLPGTELGVMAAVRGGEEQVPRRARRSLRRALDLVEHTDIMEATGRRCAPAHRDLARCPVPTTVLFGRNSSCREAAPVFDAAGMGVELLDGGHDLHTERAVATRLDELLPRAMGAAS